jgi:hypothetical protein
VESVETNVQASEDTTAPNADRGAGTTVLNSNDLKQLADDPNDFLRQLQSLTAAAGGASEDATIVVDGFQNGSALPPKNSISSVRVNPDMYSSEYESPSSEGGRIEIFTKPGGENFHGALFYIDSDGSFNATDPFSVTATPAGKRRYGFDLFRRLPLLRLFGVLSGRGGGGGYAVHGCFLLGLGRCFSCHAWHVPTYRTPPGEGGAARRNEEGYRPPEGQAERSDFSQKNYGETSCAAPGQRPQ